MLRWWQYVLVVIVTALAAAFAIELWSPNGVIDQIQSEELRREIESRAATEQRETAARERREAAEGARQPQREPLREGAAR